jgi:predicted amidohydrolase
VTTALTLSIIQYTALDGGLAANVPEHIRLIEDADSHGARLVIFPELSLSGYGPGSLAGPESCPAAEDDRLQNLREICRLTGITVVAGALARAADGGPGLATLALRPNGALETWSRVWHQGGVRFPGADDQPAILDLDGWTIALGGCPHTRRPAAAGHDAAGPDAAGRDAAGPDAAGPGAAEPAAADIYAVPAFCAAASDHVPALHPAVRPGVLAEDYRVFTVLANPGGATMFGPPGGGSGFWGPDGRVIRQAAGTGTEVLTTTLQHDARPSRPGVGAAPETPSAGLSRPAQAEARGRD